MIGAGLADVALVLLHRFDLARPVTVAAGVVTAAVVLRWGMRKHLWFWATIAAFAALHVALILLVPWTTRWIPAVVMYPFAFVDLYVMLWVIATLARLAERREAKRN